MKKTITLTAKAIVVAGAIVAFSAQSASAHSEIPKSDKGRSCWAHSRHKDHKHSVGHSHDECGKSSTTSTSVPANTAQDSVITVGDTTSAPSASSASAPTTGGGDFVLDSTPASDTTSGTPAVADSPATPSAGEASTPVVVDSPATPGSATPAVDSVPAVVSQPSSDAAAPAPRSTTSESQTALVTKPSTSGGSVSMMQPIDGDGEQPTSSNVVRSAGSGSAFSWWWLLILLAIAAETYRRYRRARQNREAVVDGIAIA